MHELVRETFLQVDPSGKAGEECWNDYRPKLEAWRAHKTEFRVFLEELGKLPRAAKRSSPAPRSG